ncbi:MAG: DUF4330 domain-containing protein [Clostridiales bacterium]|jgi:hypothetical protein|nr:DUF4330 domain-containing protein [Clostridiales bacterium]
MLDKNYRLFGRISIIDIVLFILLVVFVFSARRFSAPQSVAAAPGDVAIRYTLELQRKLPDYINKIQTDTDIYDNLRGYYIGRIVDVYDEPYLEDVPDHDNEIIRRVPVDGLRTVYVVVEAAAQITEQTTTVGSYEILVGKDVFVRSKDFASSGFVVIVERDI